MQQTQLTRRQGVTRETLVVREIDSGFRVYAAANPSYIYTVTGTPDSPTCTCSESQGRRDPDWRCKHILAVWPDGTASEGTTEAAAPAHQGVMRRPESGPNGSGGSLMLIKRSVSPDGKIDSLSVEFSTPVEDKSSQEIQAKARRTIALSGEIVAGFLGRNGNGKAAPPKEGNGAQGGQVLDIGAMNTRWGRRLFLNVQVNGKTLKLFGTKPELVEQLAAAGFPDLAQDVYEGAELNVPCRVTTKRSDDGRYLNADRLLPAAIDRGRR